MKILLVGNFAPDKQLSMLGFARTLEEELISSGHDVELIAPQPRFTRIFRFLPESVKKWTGYVDKFVLFPVVLNCKARSADLVHICDHSNAMYVNSVSGRPNLVTCHDLLAVRSAIGDLVDWKTGVTGRLLQRWILRSLARAENIACVSEATRQDLIRLVGRQIANRASVVYNGLYKRCEPPPHGRSIELLRGLGIEPDQAYLLHVGGNQPYKNRAAVVKIFEQLHKLGGAFSTMRLILAGKPITNELRDVIAASDVGRFVLPLTGLTDEQINALYSGAEALVFPSLYEGFGLPIIEAQALGCPVFTTNKPPMTEVGGAAAVYFDPTDVVEAANIIAGNWNSRSDMKHAGHANALRYGTDRMIAVYLSLYGRLARPGDGADLNDLSVTNTLEGQSQAQTTR